MFKSGNSGKKRGRGLGGSHFGPQESPSLALRRRRVQRIILLAAFTVLVAAITQFPKLSDETDAYDIDLEVIATQTLVASFPFETVHLEPTREKERAAAARVPATYSVDYADRVTNQRLTLQQRITTLKDRGDEADAAIRTALLASNSLQEDEEVLLRALTGLAEKWKQDPLFEGFPEASLLAVWVAPTEASTPRRVFEAEPPAAAPDMSDEGESEVIITVEAPPGFRLVRELIEPETTPLAFSNTDALTKLSLDGLEYILTAGVIQPGAVSVAKSEETSMVQILRSRAVGDLKTGEEVALSEIPTPGEARIRLRAHIAEHARALEAKDKSKLVNWEVVQSAAFEMAKVCVTDTLFYDQVVTEGNRATARETVEPVLKPIRVNERIQTAGYAWTEQSRSDARTYWEKANRPARGLFGPIAANIIFVALMLAALMQAMPILAAKREDAYKSVNVVLLVTCAMLVLGRVMAYFEPSGLVVPVTAGAILLAILTNARLAAVAGVLMAAMLSIQYGLDWQLLIVGSAMSFAGISSLYVVRKRGDMAGAAVKAAVVGFLAIVAIAMATNSLTSLMTFNRVVMIALNGLACVFIVPGLLSPLERLFGITTDIQLLEYSDLNNEILSRLAIEVPATHTHSLLIGQLAEAAADAIGGNGLLARVCAYYHDIGKLARPEYFSENQAGYNVHDDLSPRLSARAIASHVTEGVEIARDFHLPQPIIDGILEHHGTLLISFFYQQALEQQKHGDVREEDYRYPGPRPQSPETAILMVCDAVESGARSIKNPNEERLREFVDKIIQSRSEDRQFDECDLTLKKLDIIGEVITKRIMTMQHTRIAYPERVAEEKADNVIPMSGGWEQRW